MRCSRITLVFALVVAGSSAMGQTGGQSQTQPRAGDADAALQATVATRTQQFLRVTSKLPRVDVTAADFGRSCPNAADPSGGADSTCAIRNAIAFAQSSSIKGAGFPVVYFPHGIYRVAGQGLTPAFTLTSGISLVGDGPQSSVIYNASPTAGTLVYNKAGECSGKAGPCQLSISGLTFSANGHSSMGGLIELNSTNTGVMDHVVLTNTGGIALNVQGSSERWLFTQIDITSSRWAIVTEGDTNENYFDRVNVINSGQDETHFCWSAICPQGRMIASGAQWVPDPHSAVFLDGDNVHWMNSSIKSTTNIGGMRMAAVTSSVSHSYFEGYPWGNQPRLNHAIEVGGKGELGHLTQAISASDLSIPVDDAGWQPLYTQNPADAKINDTHAYTNAYFIFPQDYVYNSKEPSSAVRGITRGTFERISVASFAGDGKAHLLKRGDANTSAVAWPAGSVIEQIPTGGYGVARIEENHMNSIAVASDDKYGYGCSDTEQQATGWTSSSSKLCAEIIAGLVPDGYAVPFPPQHYVGPSYTIELVDNTIFSGGLEETGLGWIKIAGNADVTLDQGNRPLTKFVDADTALTTYLNGSSQVQVIKYGSASALATVRDLGANVSFSAQDHYYTGDVNVAHSIAHQYLGEQCWYNAVSGSTQPTSRFCIRPSGPAQETFSGGRWVAAGK